MIEFLEFNLNNLENKNHIFEEYSWNVIVEKYEKPVQINYYRRNFYGIERFTISRARTF